MALRALTLLPVLLLALLLGAAPASACFGPKLFVAAATDARSEALYALVTLYVEEKTGVGSTRVDLEPGGDPLDLLTAAKADLVFVAAGRAPADPVLQLDGLPALAAGKRPLEELQFTTVVPAIRKLNRLLAPGDVEALAAAVAAGEPPLAAARKLLMERRWI